MAIVCAYDFSPYSLEALTAAAALARASDMELRVVHVYHQLGAEIDAEARSTQLHRLRAELLRIGADPEAAEVVIGPTVDMILAQCRADVRLLVVGAHGGGRSRLLGSVAAAVATKASVPVLIVRQAAPLCAAASRKQELFIDVAYGRDPSSTAALDWANALARTLPAIVRPLRAKRFDEASPPSVLAIPDHGELAQEVATRAVRDGAGLIVAGRSLRRGLARLRRPRVRRILEVSTTNVACIPESYAASAASRTS